MHLDSIEVEDGGEVIVFRPKGNSAGKEVSTSYELGVVESMKLLTNLGQILGARMEKMKLAADREAKSHAIERGN